MERERAQDLATIFVEEKNILDPVQRNIVRIVRRDYFMHGQEAILCLSESLAAQEYLSNTDCKLIEQRARKFSLEALQDIQFVWRGQHRASGTLQRWINFKKGHHEPQCAIVDIIDHDDEIHQDLAHRMDQYLWFGVDSGAVGDLRGHWSQLSLQAREKIAVVTKELGFAFVP